MFWGILNHGKPQKIEFISFWYFEYYEKRPHIFNSYKLCNILKVTAKFMKTTL